jgi:hypothetical protein
MPVQGADDAHAALTQRQGESAESAADGPGPALNLDDFDAAIGAEQFDVAQRLLDQGIAAGVAVAECSYMRSRLAAEHGDFAAAARYARDALQQRPADLRCMRAVAAALSLETRVDQTLDQQRQLLALAPDDLALLHSAAITAKRLARYAEAEVFLRRALELAPDHPQLHSMLAFNLFQQGRYDEPAWMHFVQQYGINPWHGAPHPPERAWQDQAGVGALRLWHSGGIGDLFHFCRFIPLLHARRPDLAVELEVADSLRGLAQRIPGVGAVVARGTPLGPAQVHAALLALPFILGAFDRGAFWTGPYIDAENAPAPADAPPGRARRVGLVWRSGRLDTASAVVRMGQALRDVPLAPLLRALPDQVTEVVAMQLSAQERADIEDLPSVLRGRISERVDCADFADTTRSIRGLDLLISVDTSAAHLAGAMGHPLSVLSDFDAYWAWRSFDGVCPWYPRARVLVQQAPGDWAAPLAQLRQSLLPAD